jgi:3-oxoacyl-[acyl-carrier-protein] synthase-1
MRISWRIRLIMDVIATGMVSSIGYDVHTACAAARAGVRRPAELPFTILENDRSPGLAVGHPATLLGGGFEGDARLIRLLEGAFRDLVGQSQVDLLSARRLAFYLALPASDRERQGLNLILDEEARPRYLEQIGEPSPVDEMRRALRILDTAARMADLPGNVRSSLNTLRVSIAGHAAVIELYLEAETDLESGRVDLAIVGGVDSLIGHTTLTWLQLTGRLKGAESPAGLSPGEAAALIALRSGSSTGQSASRPQARVDHVTRLSSATQFLSGDPADGQSQFQIMLALTAGLGGTPDAHWPIVDQNGEMFRASDWGCSLVRLRAAGSFADEGVNVWYPSTSFGDVGAASGAVATCMAVEAHERGYAPFPHALILTSSDGRSRAGCVVSAVGS